MKYEGPEQKQPPSGTRTAGQRGNPNGADTIGKWLAALPQANDSRPNPAGPETGRANLSEPPSRG